MILNKRVFRVLLKQKSVYIGSIILVMLSSMLFANLKIAMSNVEKNLDLFLEKSKVENVKTIVQKPITDTSELEQKYNVLIESRRQFDYSIDENTTIRVFEKTSKVDIPYVVEGKDITNKYEILLEPNFAKTNNYKIGNIIRIFNKNFTVAGYFSMPDYIYPLKSESDLMVNYNIFGTAVISKEAIEEIGAKGLNIKGKTTWDKKIYVPRRNSNNNWKH